MKLPSARLVAAIVGTSSALAASAGAQVRRIDGCTLQTIVIPVVPATPPPSTTSDLCGILPVLEDGWTTAAECLSPDGSGLELETYFFPNFGPQDRQIAFVDKIKLPNATGSNVGFLVVEDVFILPSSPRCSSNPAGEDFTLTNHPPILLIDDVTFVVPVDPALGAHEFLCAFFLPVSQLASFFGSEVSLDWFACADLDALGAFYGVPPTPDLDGNGCPDSCIEPGIPGSFVPHAGIDEKGSALVDFLVNRREHSLTRIDVFEPQTNGFIPPNLAGMASGESHNTRPWSFRILVPP